MTNLPEPVRSRPRSPAVSPDLLRAAVSPTAVALTAAGAGIGVLDHSVILAVVLAGAGWAARMAGAVVAMARRRRAARPAPPQLDPWSVPEPWRALVAQAGATLARFDQALATWPPGPTRDRLTEIQLLLWERAGEVGVLARRGAAADGWTGATFAPGTTTAAQLSAELSRLQREKVRYAGSERGAEADKREEALAAELRAVRRREAAAEELRDRLRASVVRLDASVVELIAVEPASERRAADPASVAGALDELTDRIATLRAALTETTGSAPEAETQGPTM